MSEYCISFRRFLGVSFLLLPFAASACVSGVLLALALLLVVSNALIKLSARL